MKVLLGYTTCPHTRQAFEACGHEVWTCDLRADPHPRHLQCDIWEIARDKWDMAILHPMCTYLTVSAAWAYADPDYTRYPEVGYHQRVAAGTKTGAERREARDQEVENFKRLEALPYPKAIENPGRSFLASMHRKPDQLIQPYEFGDDASKLTGIWLDRLPRLFVDPAWRFPGRLVIHNGKQVERWGNQTDAGQNKVTPSEERWLERSGTYPGIAKRGFGQWADKV